MARYSTPVTASRSSCIDALTLDRAQQKERAAAGLRSLPLPPWLAEDQWPFDTVALESEDTNIALTDVGSGPVLLFAHTGFWSFIRRDVIARLAANFCCVCFDAPGTGRSARLPVAKISLQRASRALTAVVQVLELNDITLILHDLGGITGIVGASRVADKIRGLCAVNAFAWRPAGAGHRSSVYSGELIA
jgi:pimeloyl-ACP methyl ester carboxylesterase